LTHELALTLPDWRECLRPIAARLAQTFRESSVNKSAPPRTLSAKTRNKRRKRSRPGAIAAARNAPQGLAAAAIRNASMAHAGRGSAPSQSDRVRDVRRAGAQAQAPSLRGVHDASAARAWPPRNPGRAQSARSPSRRGQRSAPQRCSEAGTRRGDQRGSSPQSLLGARASAPATVTVPW
jgi:hypothetical protein